LIVTATLTAGCASSGSVSPPLGIKSLPPIPSDIEACIRGGNLSAIPDRDLTANDVAQIMGNDTRRFRAVKLCGERLIEWHNEIRANWL
jgi:hypothetical protein